MTHDHMIEPSRYAMLDAISDMLFVLDTDLRFVRYNMAFQQRLGIKDDITGCALPDVLPFLPDSVQDDYWQVQKKHQMMITEQCIPLGDGEEIIVEMRTMPVVEDGRVQQFVTVLHDITSYRQTEEMLETALLEVQRRSRETQALLVGSSAILKYYREFEVAAKAIFDAAKDLIGAQAGYVALLTPDGAENEVLFLDAGGLPCTVDPELPMPIRGLRAIAYRTGEAVYDNEFMDSEWIDFMPDGHVDLHCVMFAPLIIDDQKVGLIGLANKPGGFTDQDARMAAAFGELAAIALQNTRTAESLEHSERRLRSVIQTAGEAIITANRAGAIVSWNRAAEAIFGYAADEVIDQPLPFIFAPVCHDLYHAAQQRVTAQIDASGSGETVELVGQHKGGHTFPLELSLIGWQTGEEQFLTGIMRDITERKRAQERELALALERERVQVLERFIGDASHDLGTPLTTLKVSLYLLEKLEDPADRQRHLSILKAQMAHLDKLFQDLLSMSRLDRESEFKLRPENLNALVHRVVQDYSPRAEEKNHALTMFFAPDDIHVQADRAKLYRSLEVLLTNAINYTPPGGGITVRTYTHDGRVAIEVQDDGIGISPGDLPHIFERFYRADRSRDTDTGGAGLGLAIARKIIEGHDGTIEVESEPDQGSTFTIWLPLEA